MLYRVLEEGLNATRLPTVYSSDGSYMYHVPAIDLVVPTAEGVGIRLVEVHSGGLEVTATADFGVQGDAELESLKTALSDPQAKVDLVGAIAGAIESEFQTDRIQTMCDRLDTDLSALLWQESPCELGGAMPEAGFETVTIQVVVCGLGESWFGRTLSADTPGELTALSGRHGVHILGESGELETLATDGSYMDRFIELECETGWKGTHGRLRTADAFLEEESR